MKILDDVISFDNGIFTHLQTYNVPWKSENIYANLDLEYHGNHSGSKPIAPIVSKLLDTQGNLPEANKQKLASVIFTMYSTKWSKLWDTLSFDYNPIENYRMVEEESGSNTLTASGTNTSTSSGSNTSTGTVSDAHTGTSTIVVDNEMIHTGTDTSVTDSSVIITTDASSTGSGANTNNVFGFNSSNAVPSANSSTTDSTQTVGSTDNETDSTVTDTKNLKDTEDRTDTTTYNDTITKTNNLTDSATGTVSGTDSQQSSGSNERTLTRSGNIGVTTSQQMIQSERELWNWVFFDTVFTDIDKILTLSIY